MTAKPLKLKLTDDQLAWVEQAAADEGIDSATFVRMMIDRLSKGRAPLISQMIATEAPAFMVCHETADYVEANGRLPTVFEPEWSDLGTADPATVRAALAQEPEREFDVNWEAAKEVAAISLRKVEWNQYNPLPK